MLRSHFGWSLKPVITVLVCLLTGATAWAAVDPQIAAVIGLAWDGGGVTTGPVTVPLILALGIAVARARGHGGNPTSGFGLVTLASLVPVLTVLLLALLVRLEIVPPPERSGALGVAAAAATATAAAPARPATGTADPGAMGVLCGSFRRHGAMAARAILPLSSGLLLVIVLLFRERPRRFDEIVLGIVLSLVGMSVLSVGIEVGLARLGNEVGRRLPASFRPLALEVDQRRIAPFDPAVVQRAIAPDGTTRQFFYLAEGGQFRALPYDPERYDPVLGAYVHAPRREPLFGPQLSGLGILVVFLFAFGMGYGATLAEPALTALGRTVEEITVGTFRRHDLVASEIGRASCRERV